MHYNHVLLDLLAIFVSALFMMLVFFRAGRLPTVLAFLAAGVACGPYGFGFVTDVHVIETLAEIGIVLLLFTLGMEFSLPHFKRMWQFLVIGGALQVGLTIAVVVIGAQFYGLSLPFAIFIGMSLSISSTALVLRLLDNKNELGSAHGRNSLTILIFQDLMIVPMVLVIPFLGGREIALNDILDGGGKLLAFGAVSFVVVKYVLPVLLREVAQTMNREACVVAIAVICLGAALLTAEAGLSMALGAFAAGLVLSESRYSHQALAETMPFRELFNCVVFVSIGMMFDFRVVIQQPLLIMTCVVVIVVGKNLITGLITRGFGHSHKVSVLTGLALAQFSEFSFVLGKLGLEAGLLDAKTNQLFLSVAIISMAVSPAVNAVGPQLADLLEKILPTGRARKPFGMIPGDEEVLKDHVIVVGYEHRGKQLVKALEKVKIPYVIIHNDPKVVLEESRQGKRISYGDGTSEELLKWANIKTARLVALTLRDELTTARAASVAKRLNPSAQVIAGAEGLFDSFQIVNAGADNVVSASAEAAIEFVRRVLEQAQVPFLEVERIALESAAELEKINRRLLRRRTSQTPFQAVPFNMVTAPVTVEENCAVIDKTVGDTHVHHDTGAYIVAIQTRNGELILNPNGGNELHVGDTVMLIGKADQVAEAMLLFKTRPKDMEPTPVEKVEEAVTPTPTPAPTATDVDADKKDRTEE